MVTLELVDAGVKVAIGMLVSGLFFWWYLHRHTSLDQKVVEDLRKRRELMEQVANNVGKVHHVYQQYLSLATEFARYGQQWPKNRRDELTRVGQELVSVFHDLTEAESTLLLLGEKKLERALRIYGSKIVNLRRQVHADKHQFSGEELHTLDEVKREIAQLRESFFDALSTRYMPRRAA
jgi:hypothetical protein